jgi:uncharacterized membrane protein
MTKEETEVAPPTDIDRDAPVVAHHQIDIAAPLDVVWHLHTDVNQWPSWNVEITAAKIEGEFELGNRFTWTSWDLTVTSTIHAVEDHSRTLWSGPAEGIMGIHEWRFEQTPTGVHVATNESFSGDPVEADPDSLRAALDESLVAWLGRLKTQAESVS